MCIKTQIYSSASHLPSRILSFHRFGLVDQQRRADNQQPSHRSGHLMPTSPPPYCNPTHEKNIKRNINLIPTTRLDSRYVHTVLFFVFTNSILKPIEVINK